MTFHRRPQDLKSYRGVESARRRKRPAEDPGKRADKDEAKIRIQDPSGNRSGRSIPETGP